MSASSYLHLRATTTNKTITDYHFQVFFTEECQRRFDVLPRAIFVPSKLVTAVLNLKVLSVT